VKPKPQQVLALVPVTLASTAQKDHWKSYPALLVNTKTPKDRVSVLFALFHPTANLNTHSA
jgi:hypothetical protein